MPSMFKTALPARCGLVFLVALLLSATLPAQNDLRIAGTRFEFGGEPVFLYGISYYGALGAPREFILQDLADMQSAGFNWIRVWANWQAFEQQAYAVDRNGEVDSEGMARLKWLIEECGRRNMIVDVTLSRGNGVTGPPRLQTLEAHEKAVRALVTQLSSSRNWYLDLSNERNLKDTRFASFEDLQKLRESVRRLDAGRLVTASHAGDITEDELRGYLFTAQIDFLSPHRPRTQGTAEQTQAKTKEYLQTMSRLGKTIPVHYQEPFRRVFGDWEPSADDFVVDAWGARKGGAAGWCFHNGDQRSNPDGTPRRSFDMRQKRLFEQLDPVELVAIARLKKAGGADRSEATRLGGSIRRTGVVIEKGQWRINGEVTYPGSRAEGLLLNVRMVNSVFEDPGKPDFDPESNTTELVQAIPLYVASGVRAFTVSLQGGMPGYENARNSAFNPDGSLRDSYMSRVKRVIDAAAESQALIILGCFYQRQDQILQDEQAVKTGLLNVARWVKTSGYSNVLVEVANEFNHPGFDHPIIKTAEGQAELLRLAKREFPCLLFSASGYGDGKLPDQVAEASDFLMPHFNSTPVAEIPARIAALKRFGKPIVCNEDDKVGAEGAAALEACVANGVSWGYMNQKTNQQFPFVFNGPADDETVYAKFREVTGKTDN